MCKIIACINPHGVEKKSISQLVFANAQHLATQGDGFSVYRDGEVSTFIGEKAYGHIHKHVEYKGEALYMVHARLKTAGGDGIDGLHLGKINNRFTYAHNGFAGDYSRVKDKNDSYYFFSDLIDLCDGDIDPELLNEFINEKNFSGRGFLFDHETDTLHVFSSSSQYHYKTLYLYAYGDSLIFSSFELDTQLVWQDKKKVLGLELEEVKTFDLKEPDITTERDNAYFCFQSGECVSEQRLFPDKPSPLASQIIDKKDIDFTGWCPKCNYITKHCACPFYEEMMDH